MAFFEFQEGGLWEEKPFWIETDYKCSSFGGEPCRHSGPRVTDAAAIETTWVQPAVVVAENEGGFNSTGVCLDCILEAAKSIGRLPSQLQIAHDNG